MTAAHSATRRWVVIVLKIALAVAILAYLIYQAQQHEAFTRLVEQPKRWSLLAAGLLCTFASIALSFVRWQILVRAQGIEFPLSHAMRLGSLGFMLNFVSLGTIGGDLFKAIFLAHGQPGRRTEAVATVVVDRLLGLMTMLLLASGGILATGLIHTEQTALAILCRMILVFTGIGLVVASALMFVPALSGPNIIAWAHRLPVIGAIAARLLGAAAVYRNQKGQLLLAGGVCVVVDLLFITSFYLVARGLPVHAPPWAEHLVIVPVANMAGAIPATPNGWGTLEAAAEKLYRIIPGGAAVEQGDGTLVTLAHRVTMMAVALVGLVYYLSHRAEVREVMVEAEELGELA